MHLHLYKFVKNERLELKYESPKKYEGKLNNNPLPKYQCTNALFAYIKSNL